jgi:hypothetical protein
METLNWKKKSGDARIWSLVMVRLHIALNESVTATKPESNPSGRGSHGLASEDWVTV